MRRVDRLGAGRRARVGPFAWALPALGVLLLASCSSGERGDSPAGSAGSTHPDRSSRPPAPAPEDGQGSVRLDPADPVRCGAWGTWSVEWTAGPAGLPIGGGIVLQVSPFWGWSPPQTSVPGAPGWTTISTSAAGAELRLAEGAVPMTVVATVSAERVASGETVTFVYGDVSAGEGGRARADRYAEASEELLIKTDGNADGVFAAPSDQPTLRITAGPTDRLAVTAPGTAVPGDTVTVRVEGLDRRENRAALPAGRLELELRPLRDGPDSEGREPVPGPGTTVEDGALGAELSLGPLPAGLWRIVASLVPAAGESAPRLGANEMLLVEADSPFADVLWGDIHAHSALSDGTGDPADLLAYARYVAGLDVACVTDHDAHGLAPLADGGWDDVRRATSSAHEPGRFVTLLGYEWTSWTWGHRNVYYPSGAGDVFAFVDEASDTPPELWALIAPFGGMTIPHHPGGGPVPIDWSVPSDEERETVVEICSIHGSSEEPGVERGIYREVPGASVRDALNAGHRLGILASGDTHDGHPGRRTEGAPANGLVAFRTGERTRAAVWEALRERRVYGTSGARILLLSDWGGALPGTELARRPDGPVRVRVVAPDPIEAVELIGPAGVLAREYGGGRRTECAWAIPSGEPAPAWMYVRVRLASGETAWDSPWWTESGHP